VNSATGVRFPSLFHNNNDKGRRSRRGMVAVAALSASSYLFRPKALHVSSVPTVRSHGSYRRIFSVRPYQTVLDRSLPIQSSSGHRGALGVSLLPAHLRDKFTNLSDLPAGRRVCRGSTGARLWRSPSTYTGCFVSLQHPAFEPDDDKVLPPQFGSHVRTRRLLQQIPCTRSSSRGANLLRPLLCVTSTWPCLGPHYCFASRRVSLGSPSTRRSICKCTKRYSA
jgi:hypothetical protein